MIGGSLDLHIHFHTLAVDGVFEKPGDGARFHEAKPPEKADVVSVVRRVHEDALRWLGKHKHLDDRPAEERRNEPPATTPLDAFASIALGSGTFLGKPVMPRESDGDQHERKEKRFSAPRPDGTTRRSRPGSSKRWVTRFSTGSR